MNKDLGKTAVALSGGGALGLAHIGVLKAMEELGIRPAVLAGTSAGALIGAFYARGIPVSEIEKLALSIDRVGTLRLLNPSIPRGGLLDMRNIEQLFQMHLGKETRIEDLSIPFIAVTVDFQTGDILYVNRGNLVDAVLASIAIPGVFKPVDANGTLLVDGGLRDNLPLRVLREYEHDTMIGVNVLKTKELKLEGYFSSVDRNKKISKEEPDNFFERITQAVRMGRANREQNIPLRLTYIGYQSVLILLSELSNKEILIANPDLVIQLDLSHMHLWEFWRAAEAIKIGYESAKRQLQEFLKS